MTTNVTAGPRHRRRSEPAQPRGASVQRLADALDAATADLARSVGTAGADRAAMLAQLRRVADGIHAAAVVIDAPEGVHRVLAVCALRTTELALAGIDVTRQLGPIPASMDAGVVSILESAVDRLLDNVLVHSDAQHAAVSLVTGSGFVELTVADDGCGFDVDDLDHHLDDGVDGRRGSVTGRTARRAGRSLPDLRAVVDAAGGSLELTSSPGRGTSAVVRWAISMSSSSAPRSWPWIRQDRDGHRGGGA